MPVPQSYTRHCMRTLKDCWYRVIAQCMLFKHMHIRNAKWCPQACVPWVPQCIVRLARAPGLMSKIKVVDLLTELKVCAHLTMHYNNRLIHLVSMVRGAKILAISYKPITNRHFPCMVDASQRLELQHQWRLSVTSSTTINTWSTKSSATGDLLWTAKSTAQLQDFSTNYVMC